jgi:hypothetical protein
MFESDVRAAAPSCEISSDREYRKALERVRELEQAELATAEGLERAALELAMAAYLKEKEHRLH